MSTDLIIVKILHRISVVRTLVLGGVLFSTPVTDERHFYLTGSEENRFPLPTRRISVRPLFAKSGAKSRLPQVNVQLSRINS